MMRGLKVAQEGSRVNVTPLSDRGERFIGRLTGRRASSRTKEKPATRRIPGAQMWAEKGSIRLVDFSRFSLWPPMSSGLRSLDFKAVPVKKVHYTLTACAILRKGEEWGQ
jgi:hypothetical protein